MDPASKSWCWVKGHLKEDTLVILGFGYNIFIFRLFFDCSLCLNYISVILTPAFSQSVIVSCLPLPVADFAVKNLKWSDTDNIRLHVSQTTPLPPCTYVGATQQIPPSLSLLVLIYAPSIPL